MPGTTPHFKLSAPLLKRSHPWRHAPRKPKKLLPFEPIAPEKLADALFLDLHLKHDHLSPSVGRWCQDPWFEERWRALTSKCVTPEQLRAQLNPLDVALILATKSLYRNRFERLVSPIFSLLEMHSKPEEACRFLLEAMTCVHVVHPYSPVSTLPNDPLFSRIEMALAMAIRRELCLVEQGVYDAVLAHARDLHGTVDNRLDLFLAIVFPEQEAWGNQAILTMQEKLVAIDRDQLPYQQHMFADAHFIREALFATGADASHMSLVPPMIHPDFQQQHDERWDPLLDLVITHDRAAIPTLVEIMRHWRGPSLDLQPLLGLLNTSEDPALLTAFARRMITRHGAKKATRERFIKHIHEMPDFVTMHLAPLLDELAADHAQGQTFSALEELVQKHASRQHALRQEASQQDRYIGLEELPEALRVLPWHEASSTPTLPRFFSPLLYPPLLVRDDPSRALPLDLYEEIGRMLKSREEPQLEALEAFVDPGSLGRFCAQLFDDWTRAGHPSKEDWVCEVMARFGKLEFARRLHDPMDLWLSYSTSNPGKAISSLLRRTNPYHLELLDSLHHGAYSRQARSLARARLARWAKQEGRGDDDDAIEQLLDAYTPTLGVSARGRFSPDNERSYLVALDKDLRPVLIADEEALDAASALKWEHTRSMFEHHFEQMTGRLERALITQRRWSLEHWRAHIAGHPLLASLATRLIWCDIRPGKNGRTRGTPRFWRMDESRECVGIDDETITLDASRSIMLAHPLWMTPEELRAWLLLMSDYEIIAPFEQLQRPVYESFPSYQELEALCGRTASHEALHRLHGQLPWETIPLGTRSSRFAGYRIYLKCIDGKYDRGAFSLEFDKGIHKDAKKRQKAYTLKTFGRLGRVPWERIDPVQRSELLLALFDTFCEGDAREA